MLRNRLLTGAAVLTLAVLADQLTKVWIRNSLPLGESVHVFGPVRLTHVENTGLIFGLGHGYIIVPTIASIIVLLLIPAILRQAIVHHNYMPTTFEAFCVALVTGGAIGNLIDRLTLSAVTDFVDVEIFPGIRWPAFNVADACIVVGTMLLLIVLYRRGASRVGHNSAPR